MGTVLGMAIARFPSIVIDCPDPAALAAFYGAMLDWKIEISPGHADVRAEYGDCISFQQVEGYTPPIWPGQDVPQQMHLDVIVNTSTPPRRRCSISARRSTSISPAHPSGSSSTPTGTPSASACTNPRRPDLGRGPRQAGF